MVRALKSACTYIQLRIAESLVINRGLNLLLSPSPAIASPLRTADSSEGSAEEIEKIPTFMCVVQAHILDDADKVAEDGLRMLAARWL